jgi:hypothetical protein
MNQNSAEFTENEIYNPNYNISPDHKAALKRLQEERLAALQKNQTQLVSQQSQDIGRRLRRALNQETIEVLKLSPSDLEARRKQFEECYLADLDPLIPIFPGGFDGSKFVNLVDSKIPNEYLTELPGGLVFFPSNPGIFASPSPPPSPNLFSNWGRFQWISSQGFSNASGITVANPDRFLHFFGSSRYKGDNLIARSTGVTFNFELNQFPPINSTRWTSTPFMDLRGIISGWTGLYHPLWAADDKWCKCWLFLKQTVIQRTTSGDLTLGTAQDVTELIKLENGYPIGQASIGLSPRPMPRVDFSMSDRTASILAILEIRFDIQLEGNASIWFRLLDGSQTESVPSVSNSVLLEVPEWFIQGL